MKTIMFKGLAGALCALMASPATGQQSATSPAAEETQSITVTGIRPTDTVLVVDYKRVAAQCAACKRAMAELNKRGVRVRRKQDQLEASLQSDNVSATRGTGEGQASSQSYDSQFSASRLSPDTAAGLADMRRQSSVGRHRVEIKESTEARADFSQNVASFLMQLEKHMKPLIEERRRQTGAAAVQGADQKKYPDGQYVEITDWVIEAVDASGFRVVFADAAGAEAARRKKQ